MKQILKFIDAPDGLFLILYLSTMLGSMLGPLSFIFAGLIRSYLPYAKCSDNYLQRGAGKGQQPRETDNFDFDGLPYKREKKKGGNKNSNSYSSLKILYSGRFSVSSRNSNFLFGLNFEVIM